MSHSYSKIWIHAVWATKKRADLIRPEIEYKLYQFIQKQFKDKGCALRIVNGVANHVHCLYLLSPKIANADVIHQVKGSSSHFINQNDLIPEKFAWQTGYSSFSVSESLVQRTYQYILKQKEHHRKKCFDEELSDVLKLYGFPRDSGSSE